MSRSSFRHLLTGCLALFLASCAAAQALPLPSVTAEPPSATPTAAFTPVPSSTPARLATPTRTPYVLPTPRPMEWLVPVLQFNWDSSSRLEYARWLDAQTFLFDAPLGHPHQVSLDGHGGMALSDLPQINQPLSYSPHHGFLVKCYASELSLYRLPGKQLVGSASLSVPDAVDYLTCNQFIQWKADDSALMFTHYLEPTGSKNHPRAFYFWNTTLPQPRQLATATFESFGGYISPNFEHLLYITGRAMQADKPGAVEALLVDILDVDSTEVTHLRLTKETGYDIYPRWLTNDVFEFRVGNSVYRYYDAHTGKYLFEIFDSMAAGDFHQSPAVSPDQRWVALDRTVRESFPTKRYSLYDLQTQTDFLLSDSPSSRLSFGGWKPDCSLLYMVNSPNQPFGPIDSPLPAGLLAYNPFGRSAQVLVPDAVRAFWSPDMQRAWVIRQTAAGQPVIASLYEAASGKLSGEYFVSLAAIKGDPAWDWLGLDFELRWSHDSSRALLINARKELFLLENGQARLLATGSYRPVSWSPDDRYALVYYPRGAWVVDLK